MSSKYKLIIFDLDGTILNTLEDLSDSVNFVLKSHNFSERSLAEIRSFIGNGVRKLIERAAPADISADELEILFQEFKAHYQKNCHNKTGPYDGIKELLETLKNHDIKLAVISNKNQEAVKEVIEYYFPGLFNASFGVTENSAPKPNPKIVFSALEKFQLKAEDALIIGDSDVDALTAKNAGTDCLLVTWGFRERDELARFKQYKLIDLPQELEGFILK